MSIVSNVLLIAKNMHYIDRSITNEKSHNNHDVYVTASI